MGWRPHKPPKPSANKGLASGLYGAGMHGRQPWSLLSSCIFYEVQVVLLLNISLIMFVEAISIHFPSCTYAPDMQVLEVDLPKLYTIEKSIS